MTAPGRIHVVGVAGVGMSALAQALAWTHPALSGSDRHLDGGRRLPELDALEKAGIRLTPQDGSAVLPGTEAVVYSTAIEPDNPDLAAARALGIPCRHRAEVLAGLAAGHPLLAVAGTAGKTTTTGMLGWILEQTGADPTVVNGGALVDWAAPDRIGNARRGAPSAPLVLEVDESDRSLLDFTPDWTILTNISQDHFSLEEVQDLFRRYADRVRTGIVAGPGVAEVLGPQRAAVVSPPFEGATPIPGGGWQMPWRGTILRVRLPGKHNLANALLAAETAVLAAGADPAAVAEALWRFNGIRRRMERTDRGGPVRVFDDYAHNPAKIAAAFEAAREDASGRILAAWRPHGFAPLRNMMEPLAATFAAALRSTDRLWLLPVYYAGGTTTKDVSTADLIARLQALGAPATATPSIPDLEATLRATARPGDTLLLMGARDPDLPLLAHRLP
ncbi:MAG: UDP-N-acetylmuramate--alanine ligase [Kiritimatiellae bacterium]|nr:UDP-N-acetylmuramate--alanine ligase [Kiritimatiellia bacterium]